MPSGMCFARACPRSSTSLHRLVEELSDFADLVHARDHRHHDAEVAVGAGADHGAELREKDFGPLEREAHGAQAERRVHLRGELEARRELVAADVERAQRRPGRGATASTTAR